jgi:site-specific DNA recombinase
MIAAIYARKSSDQTGVADEQKSVTRQIDHARAFAASKGWTLADEAIYIDDGISGAEFANRPGFVRLLNALKPRPAFQILIMSEVSRLGREQFETSYALKQLSQAGVRVFSYLDDREVLLESATDKFMLAALNFGAELEKEKASQRATDKSVRTARAGYVTGGRLFGYDNIDVLDGGGKRSHVVRQINDAEAAIVRRIFQLSAEGHGVKTIAKTLNAEGAISPRAQQGRSRSWAPSSIREALYRDTYRGVIVWNKSKKRDKWGAHKQTDRPVSDRITVDSPSLKIIDDQLWAAAHIRLEAVRGVYMKATGGRAFGRPALGDPSKYLLTNLALCGCCGGTMWVRSRAHGNGRKFYYGCSAYHQRGRTVCSNHADAPMAEADYMVIEPLLDEVLDESILRDAVDEACRLLQGDDGMAERLAKIEARIATIDQERGRLATAIATGGDLDGLLDALRTRERLKATLEADRQAMRAERRLGASDARQMRSDLQSLAASWRSLLVGDAAHARPIVASLLSGRVKVLPAGNKRWTISGVGTLTGLFERSIYLSGWRPQRDSNPCFSLERATS